MINFFKQNFNNVTSIVLSSSSVTLRNNTHNLPSFSSNEADYLQSLADHLREELFWADSKPTPGLTFLLDSSLLDVESFTLPPMPRGEEKEAIAWEVAESVILPKNSFYYVLRKTKQEDEFAYTIYAADRSLVEKLAGMAQGFALPLAFIAPYEESLTVEEMSKLDLCPEDLSGQEFKRKLTLWSKYFAATCIFLSLLTVGGMEYSLYEKESELLTLEDKLKLESFWQEHYLATKALSRETKHLQELAKRLDKATAKPSKFLEALGRSTVPGVWVVSVQAEGLAYKLRGQSADLLGVNAWLEELGKESDFKHAQLLSTDAKAVGFGFEARLSEK